MSIPTGGSTHSEPGAPRILRRTKVAGDVVSVLPLTVACGLALVALYTAVLFRAPPVDWEALAIVGATLAVLPSVVGVVLAMLRALRAPITAAVSVTFIVVAATVAILSAARVGISYFGIFLCQPPLVLTTVLAALRLQRRVAEHVAILEFPGAAALQASLRRPYPIICKDDVLDWKIERVLIDIPTHHAPVWSGMLVKCYLREIEVTPWVTFLETTTGRVDLGHFDMGDVAFTAGQSLYLRLKRALDIALVVVGLPLFLPLGLVTWAYVWLRLRQQTIFVQPRGGLGGRVFRIFKFRTMSLPDGLTGATEIVSGLGVVRRFRLDELPQLINILRGDMSWIGPRPVTLPVAAAGERDEPKYVARHLVRPGLSGWAQVRSGYASTPAQEIVKLSFDLFYIKRVSLDLDIQIFFETLRVVVLGSPRAPR